MPSFCWLITWNVGSLRGLLVGPSRAQGGSPSLSPAKCVLAAWLPSLPRLPSSEGTRGMAFKPSSSKGSTHPGKYTFCCYCMVEGGPSGLPQPQVFGKPRNTSRSSAALAGQNFQKATITPYSAQFQCLQSSRNEDGGPSEKPPFLTIKESWKVSCSPCPFAKQVLLSPNTPLSQSS